MSAPATTLLLTPEHLADLGAWLNDREFRIGSQQCVQAQVLLVRLKAAGMLPDHPAGLASFFGPIFCGTPDEQSRFPDLYDRWIEKEFPGLKKTVADDTHAGTQPV